MPTLFLIAGPNGCGKSTLTRTAWLSGLEIIDPDAIARSDEARLCDNSNPDIPHREVAIFTAKLRWTAERLPDWASAALSRVPSPRT